MCPSTAPSILEPLERRGVPRGDGSPSRSQRPPALFTIGFDYFGRPPLVIQGLFNERLGFGQDVVSYSLGHPIWGFGQVTYPMALRTSIATCTGEITLTWSVIGWNESANNYSCIS